MTDERFWNELKGSWVGRKYKSLLTEDAYMEVEHDVGAVVVCRCHSLLYENKMIKILKSEVNRYVVSGGMVRVK